MRDTRWIRWALCASLVTAPVCAETDLWIGAAANEGGLLPLARYQAGEWSKPWPEPFDPSYVANVGPDSTLFLPWPDPTTWPNHPWSIPLVDPTADPPRLAMPLRWHFYTGTGPDTATVRLSSVALEELHCTSSWVLKTDWPARERLRPLVAPQFVGAALGRPLLVATRANRARIDAALAELGLVDRGEETRRIRHKELGWFYYDGKVVGIVRADYYEAQRLKVVEIDGDEVRLVADVVSGAC